MPSPALRVRDLRCTYASNRGHVAALRGVSFDLAPARRLAIVGESGAGKSTLLRCLNLLVAPTSGSIEIDGVTITSLGPRALELARRRIGMVFQHFALMHRRTARENIALPLELAGVDKLTIARRVDELLALVRLRDEASAYPSELSGGQRQRVGIARALAHAPRVLLCDEPTSALDVDTARHIVALLDEVYRELQLTIVVVSHQLDVVRALADDVAVLDAGELRELAPLEDLIARPRSDAARRLFASEAQMKLPEILVAEARQNAGIGPSTLLTCAVTSNDATAVIFDTFARHAELRFRVIAANIESPRGRASGALSFLVHGEPVTIRAALSELEQRAIPTEVVGHVAADS